MARLNESAAPNESIESLKRRFVRQNREIARVNSIQSLRIRSLESEISHLLSENVSLREQVINLGQELERFEAAKSLNDGIQNVRAKLDGKLMEMNKLVAELGTLPRNFNKTTESNDLEPHNTSNQHSADLRSESTEVDSNPPIEADGRLPVILEDKYYPRRTFESQELQELISNDINVSDLARLEDEPANEHDVDVSMLPQDVAYDPTNNADSDVDEISLPPTLETKKKNMSDVTPKEGPSLKFHPAIAKKDPGYPRRSGAKRKFSSDEETGYEQVPTEDDDFQFTRPGYSSQNAQQPAVVPLADKSQMKRSGQLKGRPKRKALEPKDMNLSMVSPNKPRKAASSPLKQNTPTVASKNYNDVVQSPLIQAKHAGSTKAKGVDENGRCDKANQEQRGGSKTIPERRISEEISIQSPSHSNTLYIQNECEPASVLEPCRPARRQRAVVSYTEPNLRAKMRRPTNEFTAAVASGQARRESSSRSCRASSGEDHDQPSTSKEDERKSSGFSSTEDGCKSPIPDHSHDSMQTVAMVSQRRRKTSAVKNEELSDSISLSRSAEALQEPMPSDRDYEKQRTDTDTMDLETSEYQLGQEPGLKHTNSTRTTSKAMSNPQRQSRRHSSNPKAPVQDKGFSRTEYQHSLTTDYPAIASHHHGNSVPVMDTSCSEVTLGIDSTPYQLLPTDARQARRGQRAAARRRSMML
ncbi:hypothetical protein FE257_000811 [Aspergillus nanangensis]|uniref:Shugoshin n=1 Tax=Aspergillus nanangensis TaxID=2582783 RepID=A0AAD4CFR2_ASPNN|nr:hypothetical protein FE257_000811 [Aspergillus nanangensis]